MTFSKELEFLKKIEEPDERNERKIISREQRDELIKKHPGVPVDYLDYLSEIGWGGFREGQFMVYSELMTLDSMSLSEHYDVTENVCFFGDDYNGDISGFNIGNNYSVIIFDHAGGEIYETGQSFRAYIWEWMGINKK
jgi:hypothetical protein